MNSMNSKATKWRSGVECLDVPISGQVDRVSATETEDVDSIPGRVKPKAVKIGIHG